MQTRPPLSEGDHAAPSVSRRALPLRAYDQLRGQLGSVRQVYLGKDVVHRRDDFAEHDQLVLLLHGFFQTRNIWDVMEDRLRHDGFGVMSFNLAGPRWRFNTEPIDRTARLIAAKIDALGRRHAFGRVHIIGHSKGGLIARRYVQRYGGHRRVKSVITLGTPHHGTPTAALMLPVLGIGTSLVDLLPRSRLVQELSQERFPPSIAMTSIYSRSDLVCPWWCSVLRPREDEPHMCNVEISGLGHSELAWDAGVYREVRQRLVDAGERFASGAGAAR
ncbi:MAG: triacylglycerol lipase [Myxococcota bacterium]|jgi:triacylglycerol lipase